MTGKLPLPTIIARKASPSLLSLLACAALVACAQSSEGIPPPGFEGTPDRLFFPTGLVLSGDGASLYVVNSDFDRAFSSGSVVQLDVAAFDSAQPTTDLSSAVISRARTDRYGAELAISPAGDALFLPTSDPDALTRIPLAANGEVACAEEGCSLDRVDLGAVGLSDPAAVTVAELQLPGASAPEPVVMVLSLAQELTNEDEEVPPAKLAVIPTRLASRTANPFANGAFTVDVGPGGTGIAFDERTGRAILGGCFERFRGGSSIDCAVISQSPFFTLNPLRSLVPELGPEAPVDSLPLGGITGGGSVTSLTFSSDASSLYVLTSSPDALVTLPAPRPGLPLDRPRSVVPLSAVPRALAVLPRAEGDLVAVTSLESDALLIVDPVAGVVLRQIRPLGVSPYGIAVQTLADRWRLYVTLFEDCGVAAVDVPMDDPSQATRVTTVGKCS